MEKYRGPSKQYPIIEKKYFMQLFVGLLLILTAIPLETYRGGLTEVEVIQDEGLGNAPSMRPLITGETTAVLAYIAIASGILINIHAMYRYRNNYSEIREQHKRPEMLFLSIGIILTLMTVILSIILI